LDHNSSQLQSEFTENVDNIYDELIESQTKAKKKEQAKLIGPSGKKDRESDDDLFVKKRENFHQEQNLKA